MTCVYSEEDSKGKKEKAESRGQRAEGDEGRGQRVKRAGLQLLQGNSLRVCLMGYWKNFHG
jgi:hypothetical protein